MTALIVIAKAPVPGRSKTRLSPPCTPEQAAALARASLEDTLQAVRATPASRHVLVLDGDPGTWLPDGFEVVPQRGDGLDERLAAAFADVGRAVLVGMDTPQVTPALLVRTLRALEVPRTDAVLGMAEDGGFWTIGLCDPEPGLFLGVPMSADDTGLRQHERLLERGLRVATVAALRDVDVIQDAHAVAALAPESRFAATLASMRLPVSESSAA